jgi:threonine aldolase
MIDLRSDTVTQPTLAMKEAMIQAPLGDDVLGDDPSVRHLEEKIADILGKEDAVFVPSGTMSNQIAIWIQTRRGDAVFVEEKSHIYHYESAGPAVISSVQLRPIVGVNGIMDVPILQKSMPIDDPHVAPLGLVCAEDTANKGGGTIYPLDTLDEIAKIAHQNGGLAHLDGARLFNAQAASGISVARRAQNYDTVSICFSKGLGAPVGSALCLPKSLRKFAIRARKVLGGGMRQSGMLAAAAIHALDHHVEGLYQDQENALSLATGLQELGFSIQEPASNMVYLEYQDPSEYLSFLEEKGILALALGPTTIRMVTHLGITKQDIKKLIDVSKSFVQQK